MGTLRLFAIIKDYVKTPRHGYEKLMTLLQRVARPVCTSWNVVKVKNTLNFEWNVIATLNEREISARIRHFWKVYDNTVFK
jgi:hypothetical protein